MALLLSRSSTRLRVIRSASIACVVFASAQFARAAGKPVEQASEAERKEAGELYTSAMTDFDHDRYEPALKGFRESYDIVRSPNSHFMIARTLARLGRNVEAYEELEAVIAEASALGERYSDTVTAAHAKEDEIRPRLGLVTVTVRELPKGTKVTIGGEPLDSQKLGHPIPVLPGDTVVAFAAPDGRQDSKTVHVEGGGSAAVELSPAPAAGEPSESSEPSGPYIERARHQKYLVEVEGHLAIETLEPPGLANRGVGPGGRVSVEIMPRGFVPGLNDGFAVTAGLDWIGTSTDPHVLIPIAAQYNVWLAEGVSVLLEPGVALLLGDGTHLLPDVDAGVRVRIWKNLHATAKLGVPASTLGLSWLQ